MIKKYLEKRRNRKRHKSTTQRSVQPAYGTSQNDNTLNTLNTLNALNILDASSDTSSRGCASYGASSDSYSSSSDSGSSSSCD